MAKNRRTNQQQHEDRNALRKVIEEAPGWVTLGYIISRVDTGVNQTKQDLRMVVKNHRDIVRTAGKGRGVKARWAYKPNLNAEPKYEIVRQQTRRTASKETHPNRCMKWFPAEVQQLIDEVRDGKTLTEMAHAHGRTEKAIENRLYRLSKAGRIKWGIRTGTPRPTTNFDKTETQTVDAKAATGDLIRSMNTLSFSQRAARYESLHTCVGAFLNGKVTLEGLRNAHEQCKGDA